MTININIAGWKISGFRCPDHSVDFYDENDPSHKPFRNQAPILEVIGEHAIHLDTMFDNHWEEPMKKWFQDNFNLPVKTISTYYDYEN